MIDAQEKALRHIIKAGAKTSQFAQLGLQKFYKIRDFDILYAEYSRTTPVVTFAQWMAGVRKMVQRSDIKVIDMLGRKNMLSLEDPLALSPLQEQFVPVHKGLLTPFYHMQKEWKSILKPFGVSSGGITFHLIDDPVMFPHESTPVIGFDLLVEQQRKKGMFQASYRPDVDEVTQLGRHRHERFNAYADMLATCGEKVDTLVARPRTLVAFGLFLAQREGRFVPLKELCPNLKIWAHHDGGVAPYQVELGFFLSGLDVQWMQVMYDASGLLAWQNDLNLRYRLHMPMDTDVFYEFVSLDHMYPDGRLGRNYKRLHVGQIEKGGSYALLISNPYGLLAVNTGWRVKIVETKPLQISFEGPLKYLNAFEERLSELTVSQVLGKINETVSQSGFFVREYMMGDHVQNKQPLWLMEVSQSLKDVHIDTLRNIVNRLHTELELEVGAYRQAFRHGGLLLPQVTFLPLGTFDSMPENFKFNHFDYTSDVQLIRQVLSAAWEKRDVNLTSI